jgi:DNA-binding CsgD family transcriptional regulator
MFLLDGRGAIVHTNSAGNAMIKEAVVLRAEGDRLVLAAPKMQRNLEETLGSLEAGDLAIGNTAASMPLSGRDARPFMAQILPLTAGARRAAGIAYSAVAALFVREAVLSLPHPLETIASLYKLTPSEMRVLMMLIEVGALPKVASVLGVSETTVRTHLAHIFDKTGTQRQVDLVKLVASYMNPLA